MLQEYIDTVTQCHFFYLVMYTFFVSSCFEVEYLLKKISTAMSLEWDGKPLEDLILQEQEDGMSVWSFLEHMGAGRLLRVTSPEAFSLALDEVFLEMYHNVLKRVNFFSCLFSLVHLVLLVLQLCAVCPGLHVEKGPCA